MASIVIEPIERPEGETGDTESAPAVPEEQAGTLADDEALTALRDKLVGNED
jgi:hypothetical protein